MLLDELHIKKHLIEEAASYYGAKQIRIFGSVVRGEDNPDSDVDFLVKFPVGYDLFSQRLPLSEKLTEIKGRKVDVIPEHELSPYIRQYVMEEAEYL